MDNPSSHKEKGVHDRIKAAAAESLFLAPYSSD